MSNCMTMFRQLYLRALPSLMLLLLVLGVSFLQSAAAAAAGSGSRRSLHQDDSVPGQAFHNWRVDLIQNSFTTTDTSSNSSTPGGQQQQQQQQKWINIVGLRDRIDTLPGPPAVNTTHKAAAARLREALRNQQQPAAASDGDSVLAPASPPSAAEVESTLMSFVRRDPQHRSRLVVNNSPFMILGVDIPDALQLAVQPSQRHQLMQMMDTARRLGFNTIRFWAFSDGAEGVGSAADADADGAEPDSSSSRFFHRVRVQTSVDVDEAVLQPAPGILNATIMRSGLDWLVSSAGCRGLRLLPVLTNGASPAGGGMQQFTHWVDPGLTVTDFYGNDTVKSVFLDYLSGLLSHESSLTGVPLRHDPVIMGWQLAHHPTHPGQTASIDMLAWFHQFGVFMKQKAPHQLFITGLEGTFGPSSPHHVKYNQHTQLFRPSSSTPHSFSAVCDGSDFWLHHQLAEVDVATADVHTDEWMACHNSCKLSWTREWIRAHLREALRLQKPLLLAGVGVLRPHRWRRDFMTLVRDELQRSWQQGHPVGGLILDKIAHPDRPDSSGYAVYDSSSGVVRERPPLEDSTMKAVSVARWQRFMHHEAYLSCLLSESRGPVDDQGQLIDSSRQQWVEGWEEVLGVVKDIAAITNTSSSRTSQETPTAESGGSSAAQHMLARD